MLPILKKNLFNLKGISNYEIIERDIYDDYIFQNLKRTFNIIFVDPPYKDNNFHKIFTRIKNFKVLNKNGILILHRHKNDKNIFPSYCNIVEEKVYGISKIIFFSL